MAVKNIIFSGDSFTWGEGLELHNDSMREFIKKDCEERGTNYSYPRYAELLESGYAQYLRNKYKFPTQVAEYFNVININPKLNGGDNINAIQFTLGVLADWKDFNFSHVILNLTHEYRSTISIKMKDWFRLEYNYDIKSFDEVPNTIALWMVCNSFADKTIDIFDERVLRRFSDWNKKREVKTIPPREVLDLIITDRHYDDVRNFENKVLEVYYQEYKDYIDIIEGKGIQVFILNGWSSSTVDFFDTCGNSELVNFYKKRFIPIYSKEEDKTYRNLKDMMENPKYNLSLKYPWSKNEHPTKEAHDIIAQSIIKKIQSVI